VGRQQCQRHSHDCEYIDASPTRFSQVISVPHEPLGCILTQFVFGVPSGAGRDGPRWTARDSSGRQSVLPSRSKGYGPRNSHRLARGNLRPILHNQRQRNWARVGGSAQDRERVWRLYKRR
jgi:hypothetical protein